MTNFVEILKICENASGAGSKNVIKEALSKLDKTGWELLYQALNPYRVFGVRKFSLPWDFAEEDPTDLSFLFDTLNKLHDRELTGDAARRAVTEVLSQFTEETVPYIERIFDKDVKAGFSVDTVNKVLGNVHGVIPTFELMLADKCEDEEDFEKNITFPCFADIKYDGERTIIFVKENSVSYYSRSGKVADHLEGIFDDELYQIRQYVGFDYVIDGERFASNFTETMNAKKSGDSEAKKNLRFITFFLMSQHDWYNRNKTPTQSYVRSQLEQMFDYLDLEKISLSEGREVLDYKDMTEYCNHVIDDLKQEGLILKDYSSNYAWDRTLAWCKVKRFYPADGRIVGFYKGRPKSRLENTIGGLIVAGWTEDGVYFETKVGSGLTDALRAEIMNDPMSFLNKTAVVKYQEVSRAKNKVHASLRFPTLEYIRDDKIVPENDQAVLDFKGTELITF